MSAKLTALLAQIQIKEAAVTGIANAYADRPATIGTLPAVINLLELTPIQSRLKQANIRPSYTITIGVLTGLNQDAPAAWLVAKPLIGLILAALSKDPQFSDSGTNTPTCIDSHVTQMGFARHIPYENQLYAGLIYQLVAEIDEPTNQ